MFDDDILDDSNEQPIAVGPTAPPSNVLLPIAERVIIGVADGHHGNGGIVPFPSHLHGLGVLDALDPEERKKVDWLSSKGYRPTVYETRDGEGRLLLATVRYDHPTEPKQVRPLRYCGKGKHGQDLFWFTWIPGTLPLHGADQLVARPDAPVLIVEGEKTAAAAAALFPEYVVLTWLSGAGAVRRADVSVLKGRAVKVWPDNDPAGRRAGRLLAARALEAGATTAAIVDVPGTFESKWDLADPRPADTSADDLQHLLATARSISRNDATALLQAPERRAARRRLLGHPPGYSRVDPETAAEALAVLDPAMPGAEWHTLARCWFYAYGPAGLPAFDAWSQGGGGKYKPGELAHMWEAFAAEEAFSAPPLAWLFRKAMRVAEEKQLNVPIDPEAMILAEVDAMNESHAVVVRGGKTVIMRETFDPRFDQYRVEYMKKTDFVDKHVRSVLLPVEDGKPAKSAPLGRLWFGTAWRREYDGVVFAPSGSAGRGNINLWRGFTVQAADKPQGWSLLKAHLLSNVAQGCTASYEYMLNWLAFGVQRLDQPVRTALVLTGPKGTGKSILSVLYGSLFGEHHFATAHAGDVLGHFNAHLEHTITLGLEEAVAPESRTQDSVFKDIINSNTLRIEEKFLGIWRVPNRLRIILTSNNDQVVRADGVERRYAVFRVTNPHINNPDERRAYFGKMVEQMETGGYEAMLGELLERDISSWNPESVPDTESLREQKLLNLASDPVRSWLHERLADGVYITVDRQAERGIASRRWSAECTTEVPVREVLDDFADYARRNGMRVSERKCSMDLRRYMPAGFGTRVAKFDTVDGTSTRRVFDFPPLAVARQAFAAATGIGSWEQAGGGD